MRELVVVGAGLSGLVAAINLAREGFRVRVRERRREVGGETDIRGLEGQIISIGDGSPIDLKAMKRYTGVDLSPVAAPLPSVRTHLYGRTYDLRFHEGVPTYLVERGPGPTSIDRYLYELALAEGVRFTFGDPVTDFDSLPPDTIVATGLFGESWPALGVPHLPVFGYLAMSRTDDPAAGVIIYFDEYTRDYAFYSQVNGVCGAVLFSRGKPLDPGVKDRFRRQLEENDGIRFEEWRSVNIGALPVAEARNPRLFARNLILAGTLSGTIDPVLLFGVHGALVGGKVAAIAVTDHHRGLEEFRRVNSSFRRGFHAAAVYQRMPMWILKRATWTVAETYPALGRVMGDDLFRLVPGYRYLRSGGGG